MAKKRLVVHKAGTKKFQIDLGLGQMVTVRGPYCDVYGDFKKNCYIVDPKWENVTCKRCKKKRRMEIWGDQWGKFNQEGLI